MKILLLNALKKIIPQHQQKVLLKNLFSNDKQLSKKKVKHIIQLVIASIDEMLNSQVNLIIHHPRFQQLEASWRGLEYLSTQSASYANFKIRIINVSWELLSHDLLTAIEFDQSQIFSKIYSSEFGQVGGEPFGLLIGDYYINQRVGDNTSQNDIVALKAMAEVAAAAFAPFITAVSPSMLSLEDFSELELPLNLRKTFQMPDYATEWKSFREIEDSRFIGLVLPRVLMREPYQYHELNIKKFNFQETVSSDKKNYLWGNPAYCLAAVISRAFSQSGWFAEILGTHEDLHSGGIVSNLTRQSFLTDRSGVMQKYATEVFITEDHEKALSELGFIPLCECGNSRHCAFYSAQSVQLPKVYDTETSVTNAQLSVMLKYILCVSRFAHYLKVMVRDKLGTFATPAACENFLQNWIIAYTATGDDMHAELMAKHPLRNAKVKLTEQIGRPGIYLCSVYMEPHFYVDQVVATLHLFTTEMRAA